MRPGPDPARGLYGAYDGKFNERPFLLDEGFRDPGMRPTPCSDMGPMRRGGD